MKSVDIPEQNTKPLDNMCDSSSAMSYEVHGATHLPGAKPDVFRASSSEHLPSVTFTGCGNEVSFNVAPGSTFVVSADGHRGQVKQYDAKTGRLTTEDSLYPGSKYHKVFDPKTGLPTEGTYVQAARNYVRHDHFDSNGRLASSDTTGNGWTEHTSYDAIGKEVKVVRQDGGSLNVMPREITTTQYKGDGSMTADHVFPTRPRDRYMDVINSRQEKSTAYFDQQGKVVELYSNGHYFSIDENGRAHQESMKMTKGTVVDRDRPAVVDHDKPKQWLFF